MKFYLFGAAFLVSSIFMFWNLENYFDPFDNPLTLDDDFTPVGAKHWTWGRFERKRNAIAKTIIASADVYGDLPDMIGFAEVENKMVLRQLLTETAFEKTDYDFIHRESPDRRGIDVALLYRKTMFKPISVDSLRVEAAGPTRDILYVCGVLRDDTLHIFVNHWPSKLGDGSADRRAAAAAVLSAAVDSITAINPNARIIAMGDFNATPSEVSLPMFPLATKLVAEGRGSIKYRGTWELIDQFWIHPDIPPGAEMTIYNPYFLLEKDSGYTGEKPYRTYNGPRYNGGTSDHLPVMLTF